MEKHLVWACRVHTEAQLTDSTDKLMEVSQVASHGRGGEMKDRTEEDEVRGEEHMRGGWGSLKRYSL